MYTIICLNSLLDAKSIFLQIISEIGVAFLCLSGVPLKNQPTHHGWMR